MLHSVFLLVFFLCPITLQYTLPPIAYNPVRIKLLKDGLTAMTFRRNGQLASEQDLEPYFQVLKEKYVNNKHYKTIIIAFTQGVLPKLTLKENDPCDPTYTFEYKDSFNNSVTDGKLKEFLWKSYEKRGDPNRQFCDYRLGLVCNNETKMCECPAGSKMEPISPGSGEKRCLLQENQVCALLDLDHDPRSKYGALRKHLPLTILNLEKPLGCKMGTQCRFKTNATIHLPLCYDVNNGPWGEFKWGFNIGQECSLGLYGEIGQCYERDKIEFFNEVLGQYKGYTCFNFGPRSKPRSPHVGICAHEMGPFGMSSKGSGWWHPNNKDMYWDLQMIGFVSPATTPIRDGNLYVYYKNYLKFDESCLDTNGYGIARSWTGYRCNVDRTNKLLELWKYFKKLEDTPPQGVDFWASESELWDKLREVKALTDDLGSKKVCHVWTEMISNTSIRNARRCVPEAPTDSYGNDGKCEIVPESEDETFEWAKKFLKYRQHVINMHTTSYSEEKNYRKDIYEPELECDPRLGPPPGSEGAPPTGQDETDVLEGGYCAPDRGCYEDYSDYEMYDHNKDCELKKPKPKLFRNCQDLKNSRSIGWCESDYLEKLLQAELQAIPSNSGLQRGDACNHVFEIKFRNWVEKGFGDWYIPYKYLIQLYNFTNGLDGPITKLCDWTKLLKCSKSGTCECLQGTQPREVDLDDGTTISSDYCYFTSGRCNRNKHAVFGKSKESTGNETIEINKHYKARKGESGSSCNASNWCVFAKVQDFYDSGSGTYRKGEECTTDNTGTTGHNGEDRTTTTTTTTKRTTTTSTTTRRTTTRRRRTTTGRDESNLACVGDHCGWQDAGGSEKEIHVILKMMVVIKMLAIWI